MQPNGFTRREAMSTGAAALAALYTHLAQPAFAFPGQSDEEQLVPFLDMPRPARQMLDWETLDSWLTPQDQVFGVSHYNVPEVEAERYNLEITGLVDKPKSLSLEDIQSLPTEDRLMTLECSGNGASKGFMAAVYNSRWTGTPLAQLLRSCGIRPEAKEVVFYGHDEGEEKIRKVTVDVPFARSMSVENALNSENLLAYQRNGEALTTENGAPLRLIVPGWYGIANVKWLRRIELRESRYMGRFMGRDYVTLRGERQNGEIVYVESSVTRMNLKSIIARVTQLPDKDGRIPVKAYGAVWGDGTPIEKVEVRVDDGPWQPAKIDDKPFSKYCWRFFSIDLGEMSPGKHTLVSRATNAEGRVQPTAEDDEIALKKTYWEAYQQWPREIELEV